MTPEAILRPLLKEHELPDSLVRLLYLLLQREIEQKYPSLGHPPDAPLYDNHPTIRFAKGLSYIFSKLPKLYDLTDSKFHTTLHTLAGIEETDIAYLFKLGRDTRLAAYYSLRSHYEKQAEYAQSSLDSASRGDDTRWYRSQLREAKAELRKTKGTRQHALSHTVLVKASIVQHLVRHSKAHSLRALLCLRLDWLR